MEGIFDLNNFNSEEATILELQAALDSGEVTSRELVMYYVYRIAMLDQSGPMINSILEINPDAIFIAEALDQERKLTSARGPLHGVPVLLKGNIETKDKMHTSAGALALEHHVSSSDAFLVQQLRNSGAIILGKTNMTEWANGMSSSMWAGYSSIGGLTKNPYGDHFPGGSSTGSAASVAANFTTVAVGTETSASILSPAVQNAIVGIKPTVGLISRSGIIPWSYSQDTAGPMARTVTDAAILLSALVGRDESDPATWKNEHSNFDYAASLDKDGLRNATIGVFRSAPQEKYRDFGEYDDKLFNGAVAILKESGAKVIDNIEIPSFNREWGYNKISHEFAYSVEHYLQSLPAHLPVHNLKELIKWNEQNAEKALKYGQDLLEYRSQPLKSQKYTLESITDLYYSQNMGIDYTLKKYGLDAILFPSYVGADLSAKAGYPSIAVPAGFQENGRAFGITFAGTAFSESTLIRIAFSFEQKTKHRKMPNLL
ncbi:amidase family protein [Paenibacillus radicis (ex Gao et al. 2016)]|uniref:Amidase n=1 Tax=Paenibacillus radicis (ex Gao et al. 2016) TaxID=1737354 RepID=A0A917LWC3_9BACL|nr:amidase family protein [Paenibacillus radicis (ex Gao et al. 2016)]GGG59432.1 amidase [Paenibacillus radicis (ex Gao et al. 2016)]